MKLNVEKLNQLRTLTMTNNRKGGTLAISYGGTGDDTSVLYVKNSNNCKDILVVKRIPAGNCESISRYVYDLSREFEIENMIVDLCGFGVGFYDYYLANYDINHSIVGVKYTRENIDKAWLRLVSDVNKGYIRFLKSYDFSNYNKPFLGMCEVLQSHRYTNMLISQMKNLEVDMGEANLSRIRLSSKDTNNESVWCLISYYMFLTCPETRSKGLWHSDLDYQTEERFCDYQIASCVLRKQILKCIENKNFKTAIVCKDSITAKRIIQILNEPKFYEFSSNKEGAKKNVGGCFEYGFIGDSKLIIMQPSDLRGERLNHVVIDKNIETDSTCHKIKADNIEYINMDF